MNKFWEYFDYLAEGLMDAIDNNIEVWAPRMMLAIVLGILLGCLALVIKWLVKLIEMTT